MSRRQRSTRRPPRRKTENVAQQNLAVSKQILASSKAQQLRPEMTVPDVPRMTIKRYKVHTIQVKIDLSPLTAQYGVIYFDASDIPDMSSWGQCFDQFRIAQAAIDFYVAGSLPPPIVTAFDYTDTIVPTSVTSVLDSETSYVNDSTYFSRIFSPVYQNSNAATGDNTNILNAFMPIFSVGTTLNINTWGALKYAHIAPPSAPDLYQAFATLVVSFRSSD